MSEGLYRAGEFIGGMVGYPLELLRKEVAYIAYHFHWSKDEVLAMEHGERQAWLREIADINRRMNEGQPES